MNFLEMKHWIMNYLKRSQSVINYPGMNYQGTTRHANFELNITIIRYDATLWKKILCFSSYVWLHYYFFLRRTKSYHWTEEFSEPKSQSLHRSRSRHPLRYEFALSILLLFSTTYLDKAQKHGTLLWGKQIISPLIYFFLIRVNLFPRNSIF